MPIFGPGTLLVNLTNLVQLNRTLMELKVRWRCDSLSGPIHECIIKMDGEDKVHKDMYRKLGLRRFPRSDVNLTKQSLNRHLQKQSRNV
jgi:hypothetical protein